MPRKTIASPISRMPDSWAAANQKGRDQARCLLAVMRAHRAPFLLGHTVKRMIHKGEYAGKQVGFCAEIAAACLD